MLDESNIDNYKLSNVVLPLFGSKLTIPAKSIVTELLSEVLKEDGLKAEDF